MVSGIMDVRGGQTGMKKGMTLLEVVLALAITGLFFCCLLNFTATGLEGHRGMVEEARLRRQMNFIRLFVEDRFEEASGVNFYEEEGRLRKIIFKDGQVLSITKENLGVNQLYKMTYKNSVVADNIQEMTYKRREHWVYIRCTLVGRGGRTLTEEILLNTKYKQ